MEAKEVIILHLFPKTLNRKWKSLGSVRVDTLKRTKYAMGEVTNSMCKYSSITSFYTVLELLYRRWTNAVRFKQVGKKLSFLILINVPEVLSPDWKSKELFNFRLIPNIAWKRSSQSHQITFHLCFLISCDLCFLAVLKIWWHSAFAVMDQLF